MIFLATIRNYETKIYSGCTCIFCGRFWVHKFYLGNNFAGILYLLLFWTFIPSILAIFDFLGLLLMSEQAFNAKYNLQEVNKLNLLQSSQNDNIDKLKKIKELYDQGIITAEEYEEKRRKFLDLL
ncbi:NINE protein [Cyanobacterium aponinum AL20118]|uniref:SHOCT domain-containing protein n=1 Tax=Cyanobacterium aponinum AL20115 TaxID=3090662 RepID=A0AAF0ZFB1_9CHRO|nr:NINE protein [Cyanobacterium aponinum]WPF87797.1 SHOCT domain-containing protein [Cyanobacterium aponinum AL20115]